MDECPDIAAVDESADRTSRRSARKTWVEIITRGEGSACRVCGPPPATVELLSGVDEARNPREIRTVTVAMG
jgi:hypothetical protein